MLKHVCLILITLLQFSHASELELLSDEVIYDNASGLLKFTGEINATYERYEFSSKDILYNKAAKEIYANNESNLTTAGYNLISDNIVLSDDFVHANITKLHLKFFDMGSIFADSAEKNNDDFTLDNVYFTKCRICKNKSKITPLWNIRAKSAEYREAQDNFYFKTSKLYIYDVPVFYMPYFIASGNKYPKKSGLLYPEYSSDSIKGDNITLPLFINIKPNLDFTYTPLLFRDNNVNHDLEVRHMRAESNVIFNIAYLRLNDQFRSYLVAEDYAIYDKDKWRVKTEGGYNPSYGNFNFNIHRTSGSEYLSRYLNDDRRYEESEIRFASSEANLLVNYSYVNDFTSSERSYYRLPNIDYHKSYRLDKFGVTSKNIVNYDNVRLEDQTSRDRVSYTNILSNIKHFNYGDIIDYGISNRVDDYGVIEADDTGMRYQLAGYINWHRNYVNQASSSIFTPKLSLSSSKLILDDVVANYDSRANQLNFANLTRVNNAFGYDIIDEAVKVAFELGYLKSQENLDFEYKFGIKYSDQVSSEYEVGSGLESQLSDLMNSFSLANDIYRVSYFNRLAHEDLFPYYNSLTLSTSFEKFSLSATVAHLEYSHLDDSLADDKNLSTNIGYEITPNLNISNISSFSYADQGILSGGMTQNQFAITYKGRCIYTKLSLISRFYSNDDVKDDRTISLAIDILGSLAN